MNAFLAFPGITGFSGLLSEPRFSGLQDYQDWELVTIDAVSKENAYLSQKNLGISNSQSSFVVAQFIAPLTFVRVSRVFYALKHKTST